MRYLVDVAAVRVAGSELSDVGPELEAAAAAVARAAQGASSWCQDDLVWVVRELLDTLRWALQDARAAAEAMGDAAAVAALRYESAERRATR